MARSQLADAEDAGDTGWIPGSGKSPDGGNGNALQYSCQENPVDGEPWWAKVYGVAKSGMRLTEHAHLQSMEWEGTKVQTWS